MGLIGDSLALIFIKISYKIKRDNSRERDKWLKTELSLLKIRNIIKIKIDK